MDIINSTLLPPTSRISWLPAEQRKIVQYRNQLDRAGYVHVNAEDTRLMCGDVSLTALTKAANSAQCDPHDKTGLRRRYYSTGVLQPHSGTTHIDDPHYTQDGVPFVPYHQVGSVNADQGGMQRRFAPLPDYLVQDTTFKRLVTVSFELIPGDLIDHRRHQLVGMHLTRLYSDGRQRAIPSPPHLHCDGEPYTSIILIDRFNVAPGSAVNYIAERHCRGKQPQDCETGTVLDNITMKTPFEMILVDDSRVSHHVSGVHGADCQPGWRTSLLIDFSPLYSARTT